MPNTSTFQSKSAPFIVAVAKEYKLPYSEVVKIYNETVNGYSKWSDLCDTSSKKDNPYFKEFYNRIENL